MAVVIGLILLPAVRRLQPRERLRLRSPLIPAAPDAPPPP